jgi:hypothetical protein
MKCVDSFSLPVKHASLGLPKVSFVWTQAFACHSQIKNSSDFSLVQ